MPFYEYECPDCRYYLEVLQKLSDKPLKKCPSCGKSGFKRLMSAPVFRLKGSGWYETDFKSDKEGQRNLAGAEPEETKAAPAEAKADSTGDDKDKGTAKPEAASTAGDKTKTDSAVQAGKEDKAEKAEKAAKSPAAVTRSASGKRAVKRPVKRAVRRPKRSAARGSRRR